MADLFDFRNTNYQKKKENLNCINFLGLCLFLFLDFFFVDKNLKTSWFLFCYIIKSKKKTRKKNYIHLYLILFYFDLNNKSCDSNFSVFFIYQFLLNFLLSCSTFSQNSSFIKLFNLFISFPKIMFKVSLSNFFFN